MCLYINDYIHDELMCYRNYTKLPKPFVAQKDIHCLKVLETDGFGNRWFTPFMYSFIHFNNGVATLEVKKSRKKFPFYFNYSYSCSYYISEGVHSLVRKNDIYICADRHYFDAVIPKGSMLYFGEDGDIVSDKLLIFGIPAYLEYKEKNDVFDIVEAMKGYVSDYELARILNKSNIVKTY